MIEKIMINYTKEVAAFFCKSKKLYSESIVYCESKSMSCKYKYNTNLEII